MKKVDTEIIWERWGENLKSFIRKRVADPDHANDILQDAFVKIHEKIDTLKDSTKVQAWIFQIARNTIIDYYRDSRQPEKAYQEELIGEKTEMIDVHFEKTKSSPNDDIASGLKEVINTLPQKYAQALMLVEFDGMMQSELAKELNISVSGAKSRVQRGRQLLKNTLMNCCHFEFDKYGTIVSSHPIHCCCCHQYFKGKEENEQKKC
ncbi:MAG TPA: RNA polymerase sigma factor SigZ [Prolixibacteraceae bacterium]|nr:RNA polymerase sigma factor SigZ [Prolixibacteraceae bacterium]